MKLWLVGAVVGFGAVVVQVFFKVYPPPAYGLCVACHMRDVVNWLVVRLWPVYGVVGGQPKFEGAPVSEVFPVLTVLGILGGAFLAAKVNGELRPRVLRVSAQKPLWEFLIGVGAMCSALLMGGCPVRTALKVACLDLAAVVALGMVFLGVIVGSELIKRIS